MRLIAVLGAAPGVGKSTACARIAAEARAEGLRVDHFEEAEILTRPAFAPVATAFREAGAVAPEVLVDARLSGVPTKVVFLDGDVAAALQRAAAREGPGWLSWYGAKLARYGLVPDPPTPADLHAYLAREREVTLRVLAATGWAVEIVSGAG